MAARDRARPAKRSKVTKKPAKSGQETEGTVDEFEREGMGIASKE